MSMKKSSGIVVATAAAALFSAVLVTGAQAADIKCSGVNSCKGTSACKSASSSCKGQNSCKGQGWTQAADAASCTSKGGKVVE